MDIHIWSMDIHNCFHYNWIMDGGRGWWCGDRVVGVGVGWGGGGWGGGVGWGGGGGGGGGGCSLFEGDG